MSIPAARLIGRIGSRRGIMIGLWLMSAGTLIFVPAACTRAYSIFLTGLFTIGTGLSILQTVANPYVTILGPIESAARRISIMGLCNKIAGILAPLLFAAVILKSTDNELFEVLKSNSVTGIEKDILLDGLIRRVIVPYSVLSLFLFLFGCTIYFIRLPELGNNQQEDTIHDNKDRKSIGSYPYLIMGVFAIFFHVAAQVISIDTIISYAENMGFNLQEAKIFPSITLSCALVGYFFRYSADSALCEPATHASDFYRRRIDSVSLRSIHPRHDTDVRTYDFTFYLVSVLDGSLQRIDLCRNMATCHTRLGTLDKPRFFIYGDGFMRKCFYACHLWFNSGSSRIT